MFVQVSAWAEQLGMSIGHERSRWGGVGVVVGGGREQG